MHTAKHCSLLQKKCKLYPKVLKHLAQMQRNAQIMLIIYLIMFVLTAVFKRHNYCCCDYRSNPNPQMATGQEYPYAATTRLGSHERPIELLPPDP
jgi:hypothetical protein